MAHSTVVIPCFNEARRLPAERIQALGHHPSVDLVLVDDGSTDGTSLALERICRALPLGKARLLVLERNCGKAEAVRRGLLAALEMGSDFVAYLDADLATPGEEMLRILGVLESGSVHAALGSRVAVLGTHIERSATRHYLGRFFATVASLILHLPVYDTQCGAKAFRAGPALAAALSTPFHARWAFDVELIGRLLAAGLTAEDFIEVPLRRWVDVAGSRLRPLQFPLLGWELFRIHLVLARFRRNAEMARVPKALAPAVGDVQEDVG
ncbi:MAG: glycosyltransferase [Deltaproteobacteria bacterium]|nr:MAG: glycosyltransferase [Deltaproteobacteria bacterium]TMB25273.1 MAG: glycosyltransferase [Deltaproteobacteria bacterium]TMB26333.1 MAG: glycosyltransferase [Deltaproteobacteria bacterium]